MRCNSCGAEMSDNAMFCPACGAQRDGAAAQQAEPQQQAGYQAPYSATPPNPGVQGYQQPNAQQQVAYQPNQQPYVQQQAPYDSGSIGWAVLGFVIPLVGLILYLVWRDQKPKSAKMAGIGALVSVLLGVVLYFITYFVIGVTMATIRSSLGAAAVAAA